MALCVVWAAAAWVQTAWATEDRWPNTRETGVYAVRRCDTDESLWKVRWTTQISSKTGRRIARINEEGQGQPWGYDEPVTWKKQLNLQVAPVVQMVSLEGRRWNTLGTLLNEIRIQIDLERQKIHYRDTRGKGASREGTVRWAQDVFADEFLFHWVRTLSFDEAPAGECTLLVSPNRRVRMRAFVKGQEEVTTPAGTFLCYRVELKPRGILRLPLISRLMPEMTLWCTVAAPHFWVRYLGAIGGPGSPKAIIELVDFKQS